MLPLIASPLSCTPTHHQYIMDVPDAKRPKLEDPPRLPARPGQSVTVYHPAARPAAFHDYDLLPLDPALAQTSVPGGPANGLQLAGNYPNSANGVPAALPTHPQHSQVGVRHLVIINKYSSTFTKYLDGLRATGATVTEVFVAGAAAHDAAHDHVHLCVVYDGSFAATAQQLTQLCSGHSSIERCTELSLHFDFHGIAPWAEVAPDTKTAYTRFLDGVERFCGLKVVQFLVVAKYDALTAYVAAQEALAQLGAEIQADVARWHRLRVLDYLDNSVRLLPGVKFPDLVQALNLGGGRRLETLAGFKMPARLRVLDLLYNLLTLVDHVQFPATLARLSLRGNRIYFLDYAVFPAGLEALDLSENRLSSLKDVAWPRLLASLLVAHNPIECLKGVRFPESVTDLDVLCMPNESMTGIKFPDGVVRLNLQLLMINTRGLKLPPLVRELNMACDGVNSINPLKLPALLTKLYLAGNNIKTLTKVVFPPHLAELHLANNMLTTLRNVYLPSTLRVLDIQMDPHGDTDKVLVSLKDMVWPESLTTLHLGYHLLKAVEGITFPPQLEELRLQYNGMRVFRNCRFGSRLRVLDLSGNQELLYLDVLLPDSLRELLVPAPMLNNLPANLVERANRRELVIRKSV